eukprot:38001-Pelagomonas_calceolata.AAC.1
MHPKHPNFGSMLVAKDTALASSGDLSEAPPPSAALLPAFHAHLAIHSSCPGPCFSRTPPVLPPTFHAHLIIHSS